MAVFKTNNVELTSIADAIRSKCSINSPLAFPSEYISSLQDIQVSGIFHSIAITPSETEQNIVPSSSYDGLSMVTIEGISSNYVGTNIQRISSTDLQFASYPNSSGVQNVISIYSGYYSSDTFIMMPNGLLSAVTTSWYPSPTINININNSGLLTTIPQDDVLFAPNYFFPGYISSTVSGTISYMLYNVSISLSSLSSVFVTPQEASVLAVSSHYCLTGDIKVGAINPMYVGSDIINKSAQTYYPGSSSQIISSGQYLTGSQIIKGDSNFISDNIKLGVSIFNINGTYAGESGGNFEDLYIQRTLSGLYTNARISNYLTSYVFAGCEFLTSCSFPAATQIYDCAFFNCTSLTSVYMPNCTYISMQAFDNCTNLQYVDYPNVSYLGWYCFSGCVNLSYVNLPSVTSISANCVFSGCTSLTSVSLPNCSIVSTGCFSNCTNLQYIDLSLCSSIYAYTFNSCYNLLSVNMPDCKCIGSYAFNGCSSLEYVSFSLCKSVYNYAFRSCVNLSYVSLETCSVMSSHIFENCENLTGVYLPSMTYIPSYCFAYCSNINISDIYMPNLTIISNGAFRGCSFDKFELSQVRRLEAQAVFAECNNLTTIILPNVISLSSYTFNSLPNLKSLYFENCTSFGMYTGPVIRDCPNIETLYFPAASSFTNLSLSSHCSKIKYAWFGASFVEYGQFADFEYLTSVYYSNALSIGPYAFARCPNIETVETPICASILNNAFESAGLKVASFSACTTIGSYAFRNCSQLETLSFPELNSCYTNAFNGCSNIKNIYAPKHNSIYPFLAAQSTLQSLTLGSTRADYNYRGFGNLETLSLSNCNIVESNAFSNCSKLTNVTFNMSSFSSSSISGYISSSAFYNCIKLSSITMSECYTIGSSAFQDCTNLSYINFPDVQDIQIDAFTGCTNLTSVYLDNLLILSSYRFRSCPNLTYFSCPECTTIMNSVFMSTAIRSAEFPKCTSVGSSAFANCSNLSYVSLPNLSELSGYAFENCTSLVYANIGNVSYLQGTFLNCVLLSSVDASCCTIISYNAFAYTALTNAVFPLCECIGNQAFRGCSNLSVISFPNCSVINNGAFWGCKIPSVYFSSIKLLSMQQNIFRECTELSFVDLPATECIPGVTFSGCTNLEAISIPNCSSVELYAFYNCVKLSSISLPNCSYIGNRAFRCCENLSYVYAPNLTQLSTLAFDSCYSLVSIIIPNCEIVGEAAFQNCRALPSISLSLCSTVESWAFNYCVNLSYACFDICEHIGESAFFHCSNIMSIYLLSQSMVRLASRNAFSSTPLEENIDGTGPIDSTYSGAIYVPSSLLFDYQNNPIWCYLSSIFVGI